MIRLNSDPQAHKFVSFERSDNRLEPVVPAGGATFANANLSQRQSQVV
jgi:hypothetical protein